METTYIKVDVTKELPAESWRGFVFTDSYGVEFKRIATCLKSKGLSLWVDGHFEYHDEVVTHWLKEINI
jgi:hypothetical protein